MAPRRPHRHLAPVKIEGVPPERQRFAFAEPGLGPQPEQGGDVRARLKHGGGKNGLEFAGGERIYARGVGTEPTHANRRVGRDQSLVLGVLQDHPEHGHNVPHGEPSERPVFEPRGAARTEQVGDEGAYLAPGDGRQGRRPKVGDQVSHDRRAVVVKRVRPDVADAPTGSQPLLGAGLEPARRPLGRSIGDAELAPGDCASDLPGHLIGQSPVGADLLGFASAADVDEDPVRALPEPDPDTQFRPSSV